MKTSFNNNIYNNKLKNSMIVQISNNNNNIRISRHNRTEMNLIKGHKIILSHKIAKIKTITKLIKLTKTTKY